LVAGIDKHDTIARGKVVVQFSLCSRNLRDTSEQSDVRPSNVRDQPMRRVCNSTEHCNFTDVVGTHFDNSDLMMRFNAEHGQRYADMVVKIAPGCMNSVPTRKHGVDQFLSCSLTIGTREGENRYLQPVAVKPGQLLQRFQRVGYKNVALSFCVLGLVDCRVACALRKGVGGDLVRVEAIAAEGKEHGAGRNVACVGGD